MKSLSELLKTTGAELGLADFFVSIVFSLACGLAIMLLYRVYFRSEFDRNESLTRSFLLLAPSVSAIFWAIQYSLPLSLGLLGALSFVRFRTPIKKAEDIGFILLLIALSLLSSVFRFYAAGILLAVVAVVVLIKSAVTDRWAFGGSGESLTAFVTTGSPKIDEVDAAVRRALAARLAGLKDDAVTLGDVVKKADESSLRYSIRLKRADGSAVADAIAALNGVEHLVRVEVFSGRVA
jgi:hypothetical protein